MVTKQRIENELFSSKNITLKRPSGGEFGPQQLRMLLGKKAKVNIKKNIQIKSKCLNNLSLK